MTQTWLDRLQAIADALPDERPVPLTDVVRDGECLCIPISALTDEEVDAMTSRITEGDPYELDDVAEDGTMLNGKWGPHQ